MDNSYFLALELASMVGGVVMGIIWVVATELIDF